MKRHHRLRILLAGAVAAAVSSLSVSCLSTDLGAEEDSFAEPPTATSDSQWEVHSGLGTEDDYARTGGMNEEAFWRVNAADPGVAVLPSGLQYRVIRSGDGPCVGDALRVTVSYVTSALSGTRIADSRNEGGPVELEIARMNPGWREAVPKMREGAIWRLYVPAFLGHSSTDLAPARSRIYDVEIVRVISGGTGEESLP